MTDSGSRRAIRHVDAFTTIPLEGNPAAVVDGERLTTEAMQRIALNQHLSETVFLLPPVDPANDAHIRIFTPGTELPFAGHPTVAAAHILVSEGRVAAEGDKPLLIETGTGVIPVEVSGDPPLYTMTQAEPVFRPYEVGVDVIASWLNLGAGEVLRAEEVSTGIYWKIAEIASYDAMMRVKPDMMALLHVPHGIAIFCRGASTSDAQIHVRAFAPEAGVFEDPVTGSANGCIAAFIAKHQILPADGGVITYVAEQGLELGQPGRVFCRVSRVGEKLSVRVGGHAVTVLEGELVL